MDRSQRRALTAVGFLLSVAVVTSLFGSVLPESLTMVTAVPSELLIGGLVLMLGAIAVTTLRNRSTARQASSPLIQGPPPERPQQPPAHTGATFDAAIAEAARDVRVKQVDAAATAPRERLRQTAIEIVLMTRGCPQDAAEAHVLAGDWTTDPVVRSFLSERSEYPLVFRVFWWVRPELAYERAAARTVTELQARAEASVPGYLTQSDRGARTADNTTSSGILVTVRARLAALNTTILTDTSTTVESDATGTDTPVPPESDESRSKRSTAQGDGETPPVLTLGGGRDE